MSVFADTSSLHAAIVRTEDQHRLCLRLLEELLAVGRTIRTTSCVALETAVLLQQCIGLDPVRDFNEHLLPVLNVCWVSEEPHRRGVRRLLKENKRNLSLTDCVSFEFMQSEGMHEAFSLDRHFADAGFRLLPHK